MLTARERQIAQLARDGRSNQEIADDAGLSVAMVKKHLYSTFRKLQVNSRGRLIALMTLITSVDPPVDRV
jgi:DNA-binding CsgD family transcriptional regulator